MYDVILCVDLQKTFHHLIGDEYLDADLLGRLGKSKLSLKKGH
jgi:hypothetical protein